MCPLIYHWSKLFIETINCTVRNTVIHPLFIEDAKFLLADLYITRDNLFICIKNLTG